MQLFTLGNNSRSRKFIDMGRKSSTKTASIEHGASEAPQTSLVTI